MYLTINEIGSKYSFSRSTVNRRLKQMIAEPLYRKGVKHYGRSVRVDEKLFERFIEGSIK